MKGNLFASILAGVAVGVTAFVNTSKPSLAQTSTFYCGTSRDGVPTTFVRTPRGDREFIYWIIEYGRYTPQRRCQLVSDRLKRSLASGVLRYMTNDRINGLPVICATRAINGDCDNILFTLPPDFENGRYLLESLHKTYIGDINYPLYESEDEDRVYLPIEGLIEDEIKVTTKFDIVCDIYNGVPATVFQTSINNIPFIKWVSNYYPETQENSVIRCMRVSGMLHNYSRIGILNYLSTGTMEGSQVICVVAEVGQPCNRLLFKLKPSENGEEVLQELMRRIDELSGSALER